MKIVITSIDKNIDSIAQDTLEGISVKTMPLDDSTHALPPELQTIYTVVLDWAVPVSQGVLAAWLYDKLKSLKGEMTINGKPCNNSEELKDEIDKVTKEEDVDGGE